MILSRCKLGQPADGGQPLDLARIRAALARQQGVPAFVIFSDKTLREMAALLPRSRQELMNVSGIGDYKADKYGGAFLEVIREFLG